MDASASIHHCRPSTLAIGTGYSNARMPELAAAIHSVQRLLQTKAGADRDLPFAGQQEMPTDGNVRTTTLQTAVLDGVPLPAELDQTESASTAGKTAAVAAPAVIISTMELSNALGHAKIDD